MQFREWNESFPSYECAIFWCVNDKNTLVIPLYADAEIIE